MIALICFFILSYLLPTFNNVFIALAAHLVLRLHAAHVFATMVNHPVRAAQALICATIRQLPLPPWLADWLTTLATRMAELQCIGRRTHDEVVVLGALLRELSVLLAHLTGTFGDFTAHTTCYARPCGYGRTHGNSNTYIRYV
jgi:hypothetical protein